MGLKNLIVGKTGNSLTLTTLDILVDELEKIDYKKYGSEVQNKFKDMYIDFLRMYNKSRKTRDAEVIQGTIKLGKSLADLVENNK